MEWLSRWWKELGRDVVLTGLGGYVIYRQLFAVHVNTGLLVVGIALISPATAVNLVRAFGGGNGGSAPSLPQSGSQPSPTSPESADD